MKKKMKKYILLLAVISFIFIGCSDDVEPGGTATEALAGDWYVQLTDEDGNDLAGGFTTVTTYNTAANVATEMFFDDGEFWPIKGKVNCDVKSLTFSTSDFVENYYDYNGTYYDFKIYEGKVLLGQGHAKSGRVTDSIYVKFEAKDDPGTIYEYRGHRKTGFLEDQY
jgi:hypothetical protein